MLSIRPSRNKRLLVLVVVVVAAACLLTVLWRSQQAEGSAATEQGNSSSTINASDADSSSMAIASVRGIMNAGALAPRMRDRPPIDIFAHLTGKDKQLAEDIQNALDADDMSGTLAAVAKAMNSTNSEIRASAVEALAWFGAAALPELTGAMSDPDEDVANAAESAWEGAIMEIEDPQQRFDIIASVMGVPLYKDHLSTIAGQLSVAALELIDDVNNEDKANERRVNVVQKLVDIMDRGKKQNIEAATDVYEEITGFEWRGFEEAELYVQDPENYELPEDREEQPETEMTVGDEPDIAESDITEEDRQSDEPVDEEDADLEGEVMEGRSGNYDESSQDASEESDSDSEQEDATYESVES